MKSRKTNFLGLATIKISFSRLSRKVSILKYMLLYKSNINVAIANILLGRKCLSDLQKPRYEKLASRNTQKWAWPFFGQNEHIKNYPPKFFFKYRPWWAKINCQTSLTLWVVPLFYQILYYMSSHIFWSFNFENELFWKLSYEYEVLGICNGNMTMHSETAAVLTMVEAATTQLHQTHNQVRPTSRSSRQKTRGCIILTCRNEAGDSFLFWV